MVHLVRASGGWESKKNKVLNIVGHRVPNLCIKPNYCFFSLLANDGTREILNLDSSWCALQKSEELYSTRSTDLDHIERLVQCLGKYHTNKRGDVKDSKIWVKKIFKHKFSTD